MTLSTMSLLVATIITTALLGLMRAISAQSSTDREKTSPFECGFFFLMTRRPPLSTRFFLLAIIFIVFDIEIVLLMPSPLLPLAQNTSAATITIMVFLIILMIGLIHEWNEGSLNWSN